MYLMNPRCIFILHTHNLTHILPLDILMNKNKICNYEHKQLIVKMGFRQYVKIYIHVMVTK